MPGRRTAPLPSQIPVGQPLYIFDVGTHKFDGTLYRSRARADTHTHTSSLSLILWTPQADDTSTLFSWIAPSIYMLYPGLCFTHIADVTFFCLRYHQHIASVSHKPSLSHPPTYIYKKRIGALCTYSHFVHSHTRAGTRWSSFLYEMAAHVLI